MTILLFLGSLVALFLLGFGAPYAIGLSACLVLLILRGFAGFPIQTVASKIAFTANNFTLLAIPFFLMAGKLMNTGSITKRIFDFCNKLVGWLPGGLGHANVLSSVVFAGMSGSAVADAAGLGTIEIKAMEDQGFDTDFAAAVTAASSTVGPIIPPSIPLIVYGVSAGTVSVAKLLIAGILPGVFIAICLSLMVAFFSVKRNYPRIKFPTAKELWDSFRSAFFPLLTPVILIGGIMGGVFTPTEAAAAATLYAFILTFIVYREITLKQFFHLAAEVAKETASIMLIVCASSLYGYVLTRTRLPNIIMEGMFAFTTNKVAILLMLNLFFLIVGCFMEANAALIILTPILVPLATALGIDLVHLGVIVVFNLMIGLLTPPVGVCLYATCRVAKISLDRMVKAVAPFYIPLFVSLMAITFIPALTTWLPNVLLK